MRHPISLPDRAPSRRLRVALGTWVAIEAKAQAPSIEQGAIDAAYAAMSVVESQMHPHREGSDIARINSAPLHTPIEVQPDTWRLLQLARRVYDLTEGVFDPCLPTRPGRLQDVEVGSEPVLTRHAPVALDLGGIAKGHAIDRAIEKLRELGCSAGLVNAGGDLRVFGDQEQTILLRQSVGGGATLPGGGPGGSTCVGGGSSTSAIYRQLQLSNAALAVSDLDATERPAEHQGYYNRAHRPGQPANRRYAAVVAKSAATADALTKCVLLCPDDCTARALSELEARSM
jgi:thiamine biosynthesis lipoprotein ApbE